MKNETFSRFDIPEAASHLLNVALETQTIDASDVYALAIKFGQDWSGMASQVIEYTFAQRHIGDRHAQTVAAAERYWAERIGKS